MGSNTSNQSLGKKPAKYQNYIAVALLLLLVGTSVGVHQFKVPTIMPEVAAGVNLPASSSHWLMSIFTLVCLVLALPAGTLAHRVPNKRLITIAAVIAMGGSVLGAVATNGAVMMISRGIEGVGFLLMSVTVPLAAINHSSPAHIGTVMGIGGIWISTGQIVAFNTTPALYSALDWRGVWWVFSAFSLVAIAVFALFFKARPQPQQEGGTPAKGSWPKAFKNKNLIFPSIGFLVYNFSLMVVVTFFPTYAVESGQMSLSRASFIASLPMIFCLVGSPVFGKLSDLFGHKKLYALAVLCGGIGSALMFTGNTPLIFLGTFLLGFIGAASPSLMFSSLGKLVPSPSLLAQSNAIAVTFQNAGMFLATLVFTPLVTLFGSTATAAMMLIPLAVIAAVFILLTTYKNDNPRQAVEAE